MTENRYAKSKDVESVLTDYADDWESCNFPGPYLRREAEARIRELIAADVLDKNISGGNVVSPTKGWKINLPEGFRSTSGGVEFSPTRQYGDG